MSVPIPRGAPLLECLQGLPYAARDAWLDAQLGLPEVAADEALPPGAVPYVPCGVEELMAMVRDAPVRASDVVVDLGAGVGRALIVMHLLSGARGHGIELQAALVHTAIATCAALGLDAVTFAHANAADVALEGSRFFLYAPCNGALLARVVARLHEVAQRRTIVVGAVGLELHDLPWLVPRASSCPSLMLYDSRRC